MVSWRRVFMFTFVNLLHSPHARAQIDRYKWHCHGDSSQSTAESEDCTKAFDDDESTIWHTQSNPILDPLPHNFTFDMGKLYYATKFTYLPRQDGQKDGNIGTWQLRASWGDYGEQIFNGTWADDQTLKTVDFGQVTPVRYVTLSVFPEAGDDGGERASAAAFSKFESSDAPGTSSFAPGSLSLSSVTYSTHNRKSTPMTLKAAPTSEEKSVVSSAYAALSDTDQNDSHHKNPLGPAAIVVLALGVPIVAILWMGGS
ncbi:MAG: hypothetical protein LQ345_005320 [Seirophora villosa]|nr:MAG: hypothetical protein LQ345_005320 [Seirophora villosa]